MLAREARNPVRGKNFSYVNINLNATIRIKMGNLTKKKRYPDERNKLTHGYLTDKFRNSRRSFYIRRE